MALEFKTWEQAEAACRAALALEPGRADLHGERADLLRQRGRLAEAQAHLETARRLSPDAVPVVLALAEVLNARRQHDAAIALLRGLGPAADFQALIRLGTALRDNGDRDGALRTLAAVVERQPRSPEAHFHLADVQLGSGLPAEALRHAAEAVRLGAGGEGPRQLWAAALAASGELHAALVVLRAGDGHVRQPADHLRTLGKRLARAGVREAALHCFRLLLEQRPDDTEARHLAAALAGENPAHPDPVYVRTHFDAFAASFDEQLAGLGYAAPEEIRRAALAAHRRGPPWEVLDLGCGTGQVVATLGELVAYADGIDIAPAMIARAAQRGLFRQLLCDDLVPAMGRLPSARYDLVTAADLFIYVGRLDEAVAAARRLLRPGGLLVFSAEAAERAAEGHAGDAPGFWLQHTGRYAHSASYLDGVARGQDWRVLSRSPFALRLESGLAVAAWLDVWSLPWRSCGNSL